MKRKISVILLCLLVAAAAALAACQGGNGTTAPCLAHSDANGDSMCDICGVQVGLVLESSSVNTDPVEVRFAVTDNYGEAMEGATLIVQDKYGTVNLTGTVGANGFYSLVLDPGEYMVMVEDLPDYHLAGVYTITVQAGMSDVEVAVQDNTPNGTLEKPFTVLEEPLTMNFNANETFHFGVRCGTGKYMVVENANAEVSYNGVVYTADADGKIAVRIHSSDPKGQIIFTITNKSEEGQDITVQLFADPGTMENPYVVENGQSYTAHVVGDSSVYYQYIATADGQLTITSPTAVGSITLFNMNTSRMEGPSEGASTLTLTEVKAGDVVRIEVFVTNEATEEENDVEFTLSFE